MGMPVPAGRELGGRETLLSIRLFVFDEIVSVVNSRVVRFSLAFKK